MIDEKKPFFSHLKELRDRLIVCVIAVGIAFIITYAFKERIFAFLMQPFVEVMPAGSSFIFTNVTEAFITYFKIAIVAAVFLGSPVLLYEIWMFVAPGLYETEKNYVYPFIIFGSLLFVAGALFCYFVVMPILFRFFVGYASEFVVPMPSLKEYMSLALKLLITFGFIFLMPLVAYYLSKGRGYQSPVALFQAPIRDPWHIRPERDHNAPGDDEPAPHRRPPDRPLRNQHHYCKDFRKEAEEARRGAGGKDCGQHRTETRGEP